MAFIVTNLKEHTVYRHFTPAEYAQCMESAKRQAPVLRQQAIRDFWRQAGVAAQHALGLTLRLARSLPRHGKPAQHQGA